MNQLLAYAEKKKLDSDCSGKQWGVWEEAGWLDGNGKPILNWKSTLLHFSNCHYGEFATLKPSPQRGPMPERRSTMKTPEQADRAAAAQERAMKASLERQQKLDENGNAVKSAFR